MPKFPLGRTGSVDAVGGHPLDTGTPLAGLLASTLVSPIAALLPTRGPIRTEREERHEYTYKVALGVVVGAALGAAAVQGLHAQAKPKAYIVTESEVHRCRRAGRAHATGPVGSQGRRAALPVSWPRGKIIALVGEPPKRIGVSEWESAEKAQPGINPRNATALGPAREKAFKVTRQFIVERPN